MKYEIVTVPAMMPVTLAEVKEHLNFPSSVTVDDNLLYRQIRAATQEAENFTGRRFVNQVLDVYFTGWYDPFVLPFGKLISVDSVKYTDTDGDQSTVTASDYDVQTVSEIELGLVKTAYSKEWPTAALDTDNPIVIRINCGWYRGAEWALNTGYLADGYVEPTRANSTGLVYQAGGNGTSDATEPTWPTTVGGTVVDNDITWTAVGQAIPEDIRAAILVKLSDMYELREDHYVTQGATSIKLDAFRRKLFFFKLRNDLVSI